MKIRSVFKLKRRRRKSKKKKRRVKTTKKTLAQEVRQKSDISERRRVEGVAYDATRPLGLWATCKGSSYTKNKYNFFYCHKLEAEYYFYLIIFSKKSVFSGKTVRYGFGGTFDRVHGLLIVIRN